MPSWLNNGLIFASYTLLIAAVSLALHRAGGVEVQAAVLIGAVMLLFAGQVHALVGRIQERATAEAELGGMRTLTAAMTRDMEQMRSRMEELEDALDTQTAARNEQISSEVRLVETLVKGLAESVEAGVRGGNQARRAGDRPDPLEPGQTRLPLDSDAAEPVTEGEMIETIRNSLEENRVDLYLQPIVTLPQRRTRFYEGLSRLRGPEGEIIMPGDYMRVAEPAGMMPVVDNLLLFRCVQVVRRLVARNRDIGVFCNISVHSLLDSEFFPQFVEFMEHNADLTGAMFFEFSQSAIDGLGPIERASLDALHALGFRFSMDHVRRLDMNLSELYDMGFRYVKVPANLLVGDMRGTGSLVRAEDLKALFERNGIDIVAERIEDERTAVAVLDMDIEFGQGFLFGEPRAVREDALSAPADPLADPVRELREVRVQ
ncbi:EAL domain-containing protein [Pyruvatibacter mobilis]|uniref:EAL domain-containing protein n=1 Tax=Pyruvatibacter mobilis TaxID=1712261 RepID=UPI003BB10D99